MDVGSPTSMARTRRHTDLLDTMYVFVLRCLSILLKRKENTLQNSYEHVVAREGGGEGGKKPRLSQQVPAAPSKAL